MDLKVLITGPSTWNYFHGSLNTCVFVCKCAASRFSDLCTRQTDFKRAQMKLGEVVFLNWKWLNGCFQTFQLQTSGGAVQYGGGLRRQCYDKNTFELFSHNCAHACIRRAYQIWSNWALTRSRRAGSCGLVPACMRGSALRRIARMLSVFVWPKRLGDSRWKSSYWGGASWGMSLL